MEDAGKERKVDERKESENRVKNQNKPKIGANIKP